MSFLRRFAAFAPLRERRRPGNGRRGADAKDLVATEAKAGNYIPLGKVDDASIERRSTLAGNVEGPLNDFTGVLGYGSYGLGT
jgi:hypothetical protein